MLIPKHKRVRSEKYLNTLRGSPCLVCRRGAEAHHLQHVGERGVGMKSGDNFAVPLCHECHMQLHRFGDERTWWDLSGVDPIEWATRNWERYDTYQNFVRTLTNNGYLAHQSGKWWEGSWEDGGFTHGMTHGDPSRGGRHGDAGLKIGRQSMQPIKDFIDLASQKNKPFLTWYAPFLPHTPHNPPEYLIKKYTTKDRPEDEIKYYAMCEWFDSTCGELINYLEKKGVRENTLIIYICDNGWAASSTNKNDPNQKLWKRYAQRSKSSPFEKGIRTPIMLSWPEKIPPKRTQDLAHAIDLFPTIAAAAQIKLDLDLPGINLLKKQQRTERKRIFGVCHSVYNMTPDNPDGTLQYLWCIENNWKLLLRYNGLDTTHYKQLHIWDKQPMRLYNLANDPFEKKELSSAYPNIVRRLTEEIHKWHHVP